MLPMLLDCFRSSGTFAAGVTHVRGLGMEAGGHVTHVAGLICYLCSWLHRMDLHRGSYVLECGRRWWDGFASRQLRPRMRT